MPARGVAEKQLGMVPGQAELGADASVSSATMSTLLSLSVNAPAACVARVEAPIAVIASVLNLTATLQIAIDGAVVRSSQKSVSNALADEIGGLIWQGPMSAGSHTIALRWGASLGTMSCNAASAAASQHAALYVTQVG